MYVNDKLLELSISDDLTAPTVSAALFHQSTKENGREWYTHQIVPKDQTFYFHVDGPEWEPVAMGPGRWFGNFQPKSRADAVAYYNLPHGNPASYLYRFIFDVPEKSEKFCIFGSYETAVGHWQAKFPKALIGHIVIIEKLEIY